jgi:hypothetical protein
MIMTQPSLTVECKVHFSQARHGRIRMAEGEAPAPAPVPLGRVPRIARMMALAIRFEGLIQQGEVHDYADLARLGHITRARATQIMNFLNLAVDIQEEILFMPLIEAGREQVKEWQVRPIAAEPEWGKQRRMWKDLLAGTATTSSRGLRRASRL